MFTSHPRFSFVWQLILVILTLFLWCLSLMWYQKITVGMLKAMGVISRPKQSVE